MSNLLIHRSGAVCISPVLIGMTLVGAICPAPVWSEDVSNQGAASATSNDPDVSLRFSFDRAPWRDVIRWIAEECDLALHFEDLPTGSISYTDPNSFNQQEAIARMNLFLLPEGYSLVRSGELLSVINLGDPRGMQQLDALAELVAVEQLDELSNHEVVKCLFSLGEIKADEAVRELSALELMTTPAVFSKTNRLMITDTVAKLKNVKTILEAFETSTLDNGTVMKTFALQHVSAEDILVVARPHLGLATGEMIGIDVSLSADLQGNHIFVTGVEDKVKLIEGLVTALDRQQQTLSSADGEAELRSHAVEGGNVDTVYSVLQTLLSGKSLRLSVDKAASSIVALATPEVQEEIAETVAQLQASEADFEVIPLKTVDPYLAISLLEEMLDLPDSSGRSDEFGLDVPKIDADPGNRRLFVRAKRRQIDQIKKIIAGLDGGNASTGAEIRILPIRGKQAESVLKTAAKFWRKANPIVLFRAAEESGREDTERAIHADSPRTKLTATRSTDSDSFGARILTDNIHSQAPPIRCQMTPRGLLLQSDDTVALGQFEEHLRTIAGPGETLPSPPIVFYLKYTKPEDALRMLAELLDGGESASEGEAGSLVNGYVSSFGSYLGSIVTSRDGTTTMMAGTMTVVADSRLNRLIAQGTANDIEQIEDYLKIIDKDKGITSVETYGTTRVIELMYTRADEVASAIRDAYAGRVSGSNGKAGLNQPGASQPAPDPKQTAGAEKARAKSTAAKNPASQLERSLEPKMMIAVHESSNSLIVTAPEPLFQEVERLAKLIDARSEQTVEVVSTSNTALLESILQPASSGRTRTSAGRTSSSSSQRSSVSSFLRSRIGR